MIISRLLSHSGPHYWVVVDQPLQQVSPVRHLSLPLQLLTGAGARSLLTAIPGLTSDPVELPVLTETVLRTIASFPATGTFVGLQ